MSPSHQHAPPTFQHENTLLKAGHQYVAGIDEAGRGAWAGPVMAGAVILPLTQACTQMLYGVNDSKRLTPHQREVYRAKIEGVALAYAIGSATHEEIDAMGIVPATRLAMTRALKGLQPFPNALVIDALGLPDVPLTQDVFYFADSISLSVAAASILAKTERDAYMRRLDTQLPGYGFARHKGYGTRAHQQALQQLGVSEAHRRTYAPIARLCATPNK
jgi:ribonuclease HII